MIASTGRPANLPWYLEPVIGPMMTMKVAGIFSRSMTGNGRVNWFLVYEFIENRMIQREKFPVIYNIIYL